MSIFGRKEIAELKKELENKQRELDEQRRVFDKEILELKDKIQESKKVYEISDLVRDSDCYMEKMYCSKFTFLTNREHTLYELLTEIITENPDMNLFLFANTRLADIIKTWERYYNNPNKPCKESFVNNNYKAALNDEIKKIKTNFNDADYKKAFIDPLINSHIDFLVCQKRTSDNEKISATNMAPILAIELHGKEHDKNSDDADENIIRNDEFKKKLFNLNQVNINFMVLKNEQLGNILADKSRLKLNITEEIKSGLNKFVKS